MGPKSNSVFISRRGDVERHRETQRGRPYGVGDRLNSYSYKSKNSKDFWKIPEARKRQGRLLL
jgi:hypothetical protein